MMAEVSSSHIAGKSMNSIFTKEVGHPLQKSQEHIQAKVLLFNSTITERNLPFGARHGNNGKDIQVNQDKTQYYALQTDRILGYFIRNIKSIFPWRQPLRVQKPFLFLCYQIRCFSCRLRFSQVLFICSEQSMPWFKRGGIWIARDIDTDKLLGKARHLPTCMHHPVLLHINGKDRNSESLQETGWFTGAVHMLPCARNQYARTRPTILQLYWQGKEDAMGMFGMKQLRKGRIC